MTDIHINLSLVDRVFMLLNHRQHNRQTGQARQAGRQDSKTGHRIADSFQDHHRLVISDFTTFHKHDPSSSRYRMPQVAPNSVIIGRFPRSTHIQSYRKLKSRLYKGRSPLQDV